MKTADLTESSSRRDERPVNNGETDGVNPQTRQCGRLADRPGEDDREHSQIHRPPHKQLSVMHYPTVQMLALAHLDISPAGQDSSISAMHTSSL